MLENDRIAEAHLKPEDGGALSVSLRHTITVTLSPKLHYISNPILEICAFQKPGEAPVDWSPQLWDKI
jgi:hypothetical protein